MALPDKQVMHTQTTTTFPQPRQNPILAKYGENAVTAEEHSPECFGASTAVSTRGWESADGKIYIKRSVLQNVYKRYRNINTFTKPKE